MTDLLAERLADRDEAWWRREIAARDNGWAGLRSQYDALLAAEALGPEFEHWEVLARLCIEVVVAEIEWREKQTLDATGS